LHVRFLRNGQTVLSGDSIGSIDIVSKSDVCQTLRQSAPAFDSTRQQPFGVGHREHDNASRRRVINPKVRKSAESVTAGTAKIAWPALGVTGDPLLGVAELGQPRLSINAVARAARCSSGNRGAWFGSSSGRSFGMVSSPIRHQRRGGNPRSLQRSRDPQQVLPPAQDPIAADINRGRWWPDSSGRIQRRR
jgi:hypothetical protein